MLLLGRGGGEGTSELSLYFSSLIKVGQRAFVGSKMLPKSWVIFSGKTAILKWREQSFLSCHENGKFPITLVRKGSCSDQVLTSHWLL